MRKDAALTVAARLRRQGIRVTSGPWLACAEDAPGQSGRLIVALGKVAGKATARNRARRIAREVYASRFGQPAEVNVLLLAKSDVTEETRERLRGRLSEMLGRVGKRIEERSRVGSDDERAL